MKKLINRKVLFWTVGIVGVLMIGFVVTMNYATDYLLRSMINSEIRTEASQPSDGTSTPSTISPNPINATSNPVSVNPLPGSNTTATAPVADGGGNQTSTSTKQSNSPTTEPQQSDSGITPPIAPSSDQNVQEGYTGIITPEKAEKAQDSITLREKAQVSSVLLKKLSPSDISLFVKMSGDGVSMDEKVQAKKLILDKLSESEYNELIAIAAKLGLSQGKGYQESLKE